MEAQIRDIKHALRTFRGSPSFTATAILALTLGIGASTAIFSVINAVILKPIPFPEPDALIQPYVADSRRPFEPLLSFVSPTMFMHWRAQTDVIEDVTAYRAISLTLNGDVPYDVAASQVTESFFRTFHASVERGRAFSSEEDLPGAPRTVVISHDLWTRRLAGDPNVIATTLSLSGIPYTVIGVMAPEFDGTEFGDPEAWVPFQFDPNTTEAAQYVRASVPLQRSWGEVGVQTRDTAVFVGVPTILAIVAAVAVLIPAHRASRVDPLDALRYQ